MRFTVLPSAAYHAAIDVVIYDNADKAAQRWVKTKLYRTFCHTKLVKGFDSWSDALHWVNGVEYGHPIRSLQVWGRGGFGSVFIGERCLNIRALSTESHFYGDLVTLRARLTPDATIWFRSSHTFGSDIGQRFAEAFTKFMGCTVAGHTYGLNAFHSGLRTLEPGTKPDWPELEGLVDARDGTMQKAGSAPWFPRTILFTQNTIPNR